MGTCTAIQRQIDTFADVDSRGPSEQQSIGRSGRRYDAVPAAGVDRLEGKAVWADNADEEGVLAPNQAGLDGVAIGGQIVEQTAETPEEILASCRTEADPVRTIGGTRRADGDRAAIGAVAGKGGGVGEAPGCLPAHLPFEKGLKMHAASRVAELDGRKKLRRLWTAMGGTDRTWSMRTNAAVREAKEAADWKAPEKKMAAWDLVDMGGKRWTSDRLAGKTVFINVWATWRGPCKAEHPHFQKLHDRVKDRKDVAVISFNVDDRAGLVQSYPTEGKYTFPVMPASRFVNDTLDAVSIPRNWLVDKRGFRSNSRSFLSFDCAFLGTGSSTSEDWVERMAAEIEKLK